MREVERLLRAGDKEEVVRKVVDMPKAVKGLEVKDHGDACGSEDRVKKEPEGKSFDLGD